MHPFLCLVCDCGCLGALGISGVEDGSTPRVMCHGFFQIARSLGSDWHQIADGRSEPAEAREGMGNGVRGPARARAPHEAGTSGDGWLSGSFPRLSSLVLGLEVDLSSGVPEDFGEMKRHVGMTRHVVADGKRDSNAPKRVGLHYPAVSCPDFASVSRSRATATQLLGANCRP